MSRLTLLAALALVAPQLSQSAMASIGFGDKAELVFLLWDPIAKVSYSTDLGLDARYFWGDAQQDAGYQKFFRLDRGDAALAEFLTKSTEVSNQRWVVLGIDAAAESGVPGTMPALGAMRFFTTLKQGPAEGVINPDYSAMTGMSNQNLMQAMFSTSSALQGLNNAPASARLNTHRGDVSSNGSSIDLEGANGYFAKGSGFWSKDGATTAGDAFWGEFSVSNRVGQSSWFYMLSNSSQLGFSSEIAVDEFDNLGGNGYWGLAAPGAGYYDLSFTMPAASPQARTTTEEGLRRVSATDFAARLSSRQIELPFDEFGVSAASSPGLAAAVPEPATWASLLAGLLTLGWTARGRSSRR